MSGARVPLASIKSITLRAGRDTRARRGAPIPQLQCIGKACEVYQPDAVQCTNMGDDGTGNMQWKTFPEGFGLEKST
ncbi:hypothetical protein EHS25_001424 [Saitozyma podzolica]|uniref:Store-operated calcium entry-associated regulatory factor n=1 Tax=Saitozyma podzolica TaxID=1890683 RepID=A0A427YFZ4_9TREE|nr:hypothetical protein EHS25_001424 [Saitozyma podzolica]